MISPPISQWVNTATKDYWTKRILGYGLTSDFPYPLTGNVRDNNGSPKRLYGFSVFNSIYGSSLMYYAPYYGDGGPGHNPYYSLSLQLVYDGWVYFPTVGWDSVGNKIGLRLIAFNPATNTAVTVTQYDMSPITEGDVSNSWVGGADVAIDPVTGIGVVCGYLTATTVIVRYFGGGGGGYYYETAYQTFTCMRTFNAGTRTANPSYRATVFANNYTYSTSPTYNRANMPLVCAYNNAGIYFEYMADGTRTYKNITNLSSSPAIGSTIVSGATPYSPITGPNLFITSASPSTLRNATLTWTLPYYGDGGGNIITVFAEDESNWYVVHGYYHITSPGMKYARVLKLAKAGTTVTDMGLLWSKAGASGATPNYPYYYYQNKLDVGIGGHKPCLGPRSVVFGAGTGASLRIDDKEIS